MTNWTDTAKIEDPNKRPPLEWETVGEFKDEGLCVRVNRAKKTRRFSIEVGSAARDGHVRKFIPLRWEVENGEVVIKEPSDLAKLAALLGQATDLIKDTLKKEGVTEQRKQSGDREPMRKGKTERDRNKKKHRDHT